MTERLTPEVPADATDADLTEAVREAVLATPGVAFLRPGLADLLRSALRTPSRSSGVRLTRTGDAHVRHADIHVVLHRGHRAVDVTREVRAAVTEVLRRRDGRSRPPRVSVTVTGRV
ncbi:Asp23/Gls24 family envelope stress response protein [Streptomyces sp. NPDC058284]|uniref:Asp23/Gls24 family envelope stress response protein n=1 Tax=unclassified Streptomyces TaxID=2593676 RepID=UPI0036497947